MEAEILEQPEVLRRQLETLDQFRSVAASVRQHDPAFVLIAARGTSDHAALYAKYLIETRLGIPCGLASMSTYTAYQANPRLERCLWIAISQSGGSTDLVESTRTAARQGALTVAVTNSPESPLASVAHACIDAAAGEERSVAATKTYTAELLATWLLVDAWDGGNGNAARPLPAEMSRLLQSPQPVWPTAGRQLERLVVVGRGFSYPTAREGALKLMETCYISAQAFSGADLMHGPMAMMDETQSAIVIASPGVGSSLLDPVLERLKGTGADLLVVGPSDFASQHIPAAVIAVDADIPEELAPLLQIVPLQWLALELSLARGLDPDHPRGLSKITITN